MSKRRAPPRRSGCVKRPTRHRVWSRQLSVAAVERKKEEARRGESLSESRFGGAPRPRLRMRGSRARRPSSPPRRPPPSYPPPTGPVDSRARGHEPRPRVPRPPTRRPDQPPSSRASPRAFALSSQPWIPPPSSRRPRVKGRGPAPRARRRRGTRRRHPPLPSPPCRSPPSASSPSFARASARPPRAVSARVWMPSSPRLGRGGEPRNRRRPVRR